ncbi:MAG: cupin domain-containing protein [Pseudomonadota bacterium]
MATKHNRPSCIVNRHDLQEADDAHYPGSDELLSIGAPMAAATGLTALGVHHELLPPGRRTSWPHAERDLDEFVYVLEGRPQVWLDGEVHDLAPGDGVGFPRGTGIAHTFLNNTADDVRLLVIGEKSRPGVGLHYPCHPARNAEIGERHWSDRPQRPLGSHDGMPDQLRKRTA